MILDTSDAPDLTNKGIQKIHIKGSMPLPKTADVGQIIKKLKEEKKNMPKTQRVAIALSVVRKYGTNIPKKTRMTSSDGHTYM